MATTHCIVYKPREDIAHAVKKGYLRPVQLCKHITYQTAPIAISLCRDRQPSIDHKSTVCLSDNHNKDNHYNDSIQFESTQNEFEPDTLYNELDSNPQPFLSSNSIHSLPDAVDENIINHNKSKKIEDPFHQNSQSLTGNQTDKSVPDTSFSFLSALSAPSQPFPEFDDIHSLFSEIDENLKPNVIKRRSSSILFMQKIANYSQRRESSISIERLIRSQSQTDVEPQNDDKFPSDYTTGDESNDEDPPAEFKQAMDILDEFKQNHGGKLPSLGTIAKMFKVSWSKTHAIVDAYAARMGVTKEILRQNMIDKRKKVTVRQEKKSNSDCITDDESNGNDLVPIPHPIAPMSSSAKCKMCFCGETFVSESQLQRHSKSHSNIIGYKCNDCERTFRFKADVIRHVKDIEGHVVDLDQFIECLITESAEKTQSKRKEKRDKKAPKRKRKRKILYYDRNAVWTQKYDDDYKPHRHKKKKRKKNRQRKMDKDTGNNLLTMEETDDSNVDLFWKNIDVAPNVLDFKIKGSRSWSKRIQIENKHTSHCVYFEIDLKSEKNRNVSQVIRFADDCKLSSVVGAKCMKRLQLIPRKQFIADHTNIDCRKEVVGKIWINLTLKTKQQSIKTQRCVSIRFVYI